MRLLLRKELRLTASPLSYLFIAFAFMVLIPQYPILVGAFFVCFGIFHSFQAAREAGDTLYTAMLPVEKADVVRAKYIFAIFIQTCALLLVVILTVLRMTFFSEAVPYMNNSLMNANVACIGYFLIVYAVFNCLFIGNFFKTAYKIGVPFLVFGIVTFLVIGVGETLIHIPGLDDLNSTSFKPLQLAVLGAGIVIYLLATFISMHISEKRFNKIDL